MINRNLDFDGFAPFRMTVRYLDMTGEDIVTTDESHVHSECEIYINVSGDVSFMVEHSIYPIYSGDVIITRPFEYHHCIYHSKEEHKHFWILFQPGGNRRYLDLFFNRPAGVGNRLCLSPEDQKELFLLCNRILEQADNSLECQISFWKLIALLNKGVPDDSGNETFPDDVRAALRYISDHFTEPISMSSLAEIAHISVNTLERSFKRYLSMTPSSYLRKKRLSHALKLLAEGRSVTETAENCGFSDYNNFIQLFKKSYGMTPLMYKKRVAERIPKDPSV